MKKIGFFGGSFNPPTIAHLEIVDSAINEFNLDKLIIVPMGDKYQKDGLISFEHRKKMLELAFKYNNKVEISNMQENQTKRVYAIDSFKSIDKKYSNYSRYFIMGMDNFSNIQNWKNYEELIDKRKFIVFKRNNIEVNCNLKDVQFLNINQDVSSTLVRKQIKLNENFNNLVNLDVVKYIKINELYK